MTVLPLNTLDRLTLSCETAIPAVLMAHRKLVSCGA
jgi:hypothetical protein